MYIYICVFLHLLGDFLYIITCTCNYILWPLAPREYNLSIPNMVSEPILRFSFYPPILCWPPPARPGTPVPVLVAVLSQSVLRCPAARQDRVPASRRPLAPLIARNRPNQSLLAPLAQPPGTRRQVCSHRRQELAPLVARSLPGVRPDRSADRLLLPPAPVTDAASCSRSRLLSIPPGSAAR
jgi:hypothetical protein